MHLETESTALVLSLSAAEVRVAQRDTRIRIDGKFFRHGTAKWYVKGFSYGPFAPNSDGEHLPSREQVRCDFEHMARLGANAIRVYFPPPVWLLDEALDHHLRVFIDVPWEKHRCFFEDWEAQQRAHSHVRETARTLGNHPAVFAISVVNEIPSDIVRFYGHRRVEKFIGQLIETAKNEAPECLTTFVNFPSTEFVNPAACDFHCFNVYLHDPEKLGRYLDRLQHIAGNRPLLLGEYGIDSIRQGDDEQARLIGAHINRVFRHGLAGSFVFAYTDDWFTGGHQIEDWAFGVTDVHRAEKPSAFTLAGAWKRAPHADGDDLPRVSVVVCSYNGAATLRGCLDSLMCLDYPDYEVILVDDGSTDETPDIAADFPQVRCVRQENRGLSAARNVGALNATGEIVAYTDSDCEADEHWLRYLVTAMEDQDVDAIGGPNITPCSDGRISICVGAGPGNPSHVMLDDHHAEHVPGCNLGVRRDVLLGLGGFDSQFRVAGDDVDICWRLLDAGMKIGYAPAAIVWHHRRTTVRAYLKQQIGYGRSEAMVHFKHPRRCGTFGRSNWRGIIYGDGAVGLPLMPETIYHGQFGLAPYQTIYRHNEYGFWSCMMSLEWHLLAGFFLVLATLYWPLALVSAGMWGATGVLAARSALKSPLPKGAPWWSRPLVGLLYVLQPLVRGWHRQTHFLRKTQYCPRSCKLPPCDSRDERKRDENASSGESNMPAAKRISATEHDLYWDSDQARGRQELLEAMVGEAAECGWRGDFEDAWSASDVKLLGDRWHNIRICTATEELGWPKRFTRARCSLRPTLFSHVVTTAALIWSIAALISFQLWALIAAVILLTVIATSRILSRRRCLRSVTELVARAGRTAKLRPHDDNSESSTTEPYAPPEGGGLSVLNGERQSYQPVDTEPQPVDTEPQPVDTERLHPVSDFPNLSGMSIPIHTTLKSPVLPAGRLLK